MRQQLNQHHLFFADDGITDVRGVKFCGTCGLPESNRLHDLPARDAAEVAEEQRRMGGDE